MSAFNWCFIGTGKLAHQVAKEIIKSGRHKIVSCYTRSFENGKAFAEEFGGKAYENARDAILHEGVDAVYVVTTHNAHYRYVKTALECKKPVLCEKAFTVTAEETDELIALSKEKGVYLCEAMWTWFSQAAITAKKWVDEGRIGPVRSASFTYHMKSINYAPRVSDPKRAGGALLDITIYPVTYAYRLFGMPEKIESKGVLSGGIDTGEEVDLTFKNGVKAHISASITDFKGLEKMVITGDAGKIIAPFYHFSGKLFLRKGLFKRERYVSPNGPVNGYLEEFDTVASEIREGLTESRLVPLKCTSNVMHVLDEIRSQIGLHYDDLE